jgi:hypothetical protein
MSNKKKTPSIPVLFVKYSKFSGAISNLLHTDITRNICNRTVKNTIQLAFHLLNTLLLFLLILPS